MFSIGVSPTNIVRPLSKKHYTLCSKTTIGAIAIGIGFFAFVIALVVANSEGKGGELTTIYKSF